MTLVDVFFVLSLLNVALEQATFGAATAGVAETASSEPAATHDREQANGTTNHVFCPLVGCEKPSVANASPS